MRNIRFVVISLAIGGLGLTQLGSVSAFGAYREQVVKQFKLTNNRIGCTYCHVSADGGAPWNTFGQAVQNKLSGDIGKALFEVLSDKKDADGDGYLDMLEVFAGTLPGNKDSAPLVTAAALTVAFEKAGGVDQYKP
jgi:hypothetical protein